MAFLSVLLLVVLLALPHSLVLLFPEEGEWLAQVTSATFPWIILFLIILIFYEGIKSILSNLSEVSAAGITAKVGQSGITLTEDQLTLLRQHLDELTQGNEGSQQLARTYFLRFIAVTIYGSQYEFLMDLADNGPRGRVIALGFYTNFTARLAKKLAVTFEEWMVFLTNNSPFQLTTLGTTK